VARTINSITRIGILYTLEILCMVTRVADTHWVAARDDTRSMVRAVDPLARIFILYTFQALSVISVVTIACDTAVDHYALAITSTINIVTTILMTI
jgi:hypothetical protein